MPHRIISLAEEALGCALRVDGDIGLLERPRRALLFSRSQRHPTPADPRIRAAIDATRTLIAAGETLVAGAHRVPWDLALWTCRNHGGGAIVALEERDAPFEILPVNTLVVWPEKRLPELDKEARQRQRDRLVGFLASSAYAVHVRPSGNMASIGAELHARGYPVETWPVESTPLTRMEAGAALSTPISAPLRPWFLDRLTHFTREPEGRWPGEGYAAYLQWLASGPGYAPRDAFQALRRILFERRIRACGRLIPLNEPMVCLTRREPAELLAENRWRKGLSRWTYSRYALSFLSADLEKLGARPVDYLQGDALKTVPPSERCFAQIDSSAGIDWKSEEEWRVRGDLDFSTLAPKHIVAMAATAREAEALQREFHVQSAVL